MYGIKKGFTLIEVALFLAISAALFAAIVGGVQNSIYQQRANDSVQSFMEFLRTAYSEAMNVQSMGNGRSEKAIYGRLITFGESVGLDGSTGNDSNPSRQNIIAYDVVGDINDGSGAAGLLKRLKALNANVLYKENDEMKRYGIVENYVPKWGAVIQSKNGKLFTGALLIARHPDSGVVYTFFSRETPEVNKSFNDKKVEVIDGNDWTESFVLEAVDFCINPNGTEKVSNRQNVRIIKGARSGSGVELIPESAEDYGCEWEN